MDVAASILCQGGEKKTPRVRLVLEPEGVDSSPSLKGENHRGPFQLLSVPRQRCREELMTSICKIAGLGLTLPNE